jgi:F0F1-type ATP synthase epsilon subunit
MADERTLHVDVCTPRESVASLDVHSLRVPSDTGQVGLRPRSEPGVLAIEPGLILASALDGLVFIATAGGLLRCDGQRAVVITPVAVAGRDAHAVRERLEEAMTTPRAELELRLAIERLETGILRELRADERVAPRVPTP